MGADTHRLAALPLVPHRKYFRIAAQAGRPGLYEGEPEVCRRIPLPFVAILAQLGLFLAVFHVYRIEGQAFHRLVATALAALPVHYLLHYRWKKRFFVAASIAGLVWTFGWITAAFVLALSAMLIGVCYLPVSWGLRATIIAGSTLMLGLFRPTLSAGFVPDSVWPILATMFMFRMIVYLYELKHAKKQESLVDTLSYFFLLPNYCFLHFPVVDYRTMQRGYFARDVHETQRAGLRMMFHGLTHLLLYRLVYQECYLPAEDVRSAATLLQYVVCNYLLYLRVSGQFHIACGLLHLFGFQLPETHHHYLLATGFTDYWRRVNIYWKDFMVRVVFNPVAFRLKRWPQPAALAIATTVVFLTTWLLHAYQSFWLRGTWGFSAPDALFWGVLGALVLANVQLDARGARPRQSRLDASSPRALLVRGAKIAVTFTTIAVLWSIWSSPSLGSWAWMIRRGLRI